MFPIMFHSNITFLRVNTSRPDVPVQTLAPIYRPYLLNICLICDCSHITTSSKETGSQEMPVGECLGYYTNNAQVNDSGRQIPEDPAGKPPDPARNHPGYDVRIRKSNPGP